MAISTVTTLIILVAAVLPGYVVQLLVERLYATRRTTMDAFERLLHGLYYSAFVWASVVAVAWALGLEDELVSAAQGKSHPAVYAGAFLAIGPVALLIASLGARWQRSGYRARALEALGTDLAHSTDAAWDWCFQQESAGKLVRFFLEDGSVLGGPWDNGSFASISADGRDIFLAEPWELDPTGWFVGPISSAAGTWIRGDRIVRVELHSWPAP